MCICVRLCVYCAQLLFFLALVGLKMEATQQPDSHASGSREPGEPFNEDGAMCIGSQSQVGQFRRDDLIDSFIKLKEKIKIKVIFQILYFLFCF